MTDIKALREARERLAGHAEMLDSAALPMKSEVFVMCGSQAAEMRDDLHALLDRITTLEEGLRDLRVAFGDPMTRRALGGHNERQQIAILRASTLLKDS